MQIPHSRGEGAFRLRPWSPPDSLCGIPLGSFSHPRMSLGPPLNHGNQYLSGWGQACVVLKTPQVILISSPEETHAANFL